MIPNSTQSVWDEPNKTHLRAKLAHAWPLLLLFVALVLFSCGLLFLSGCAYLPGKIQAISETGQPLFETVDGKLTTEPVDPDTGKPNQPFMEYREDGGVIKDATGVVRGILPPPWGEIAGAIGGLAALGVSVWARKKNAEAKAGRELVGQIEKSPDVKAAVKKELAPKASENLKALVRTVTDAKG